MSTYTLRRAAWPLLATIVWATSFCFADDPADREPAKLPAHASRKPAARLVPFPEDEPTGVAKTESKAAQPAPRQSNFKPRFKSPAVRQAQHLEPVEAVETTGPELKAAASTPEPSQPDKGQADKGQTNARALVDQAFAKSKASASDSDYTEVIDLCRRAMSEGLTKAYDDYSRRLMGWAYNRRGESHANAGRDKEALADFEAAVEASGSWRAIHNRGVSYAALGRIPEAMADLDRAIALNRSYPNAYYNRGELKYKQGDFSAALADYNTAVELNPKDSAILNSRGHTLYRLERFGEALRDYGEAIKLDPGNVAALINRGDTYSDLGRYAEAAKDYRGAVRIAPKLGRAYHSVAWFMSTCPDEHYRNEKLAMEAARKAIEIDGANYRNLSTLAAAQASAGLFAEAKDTQEKAIAKAAKRDVVTAEKMMSLYDRDLAFRERPRTAFQPSEEMEDRNVRQASGYEPAEGSGRWPNRQASGRSPARPQGRPSQRSRY
jgi:tetratricopeptide (TPR) repeat protein